MGHVKSWYRAKSNIFWTVAFPLLLVLLFGLIFSGGGNKFDLYIQNNDLDSAQHPTKLSASFVRALNQSGALALHEVTSGTDAVAFIRTDARVHNRAARLLIVSGEFERNVLSGSGRAGVTLLLDQADQSSPIVAGVVRAVVDAFNLNASGGKELVQISTGTIEARGYRYIDFFVPGVIGMNLLTSGVFWAVNTNARYRELKILRKLATTPLSKIEWILALILHQLFLGMVSLGVIFVFGKVVFGLQATITLPAIAMIFTAAFLFSGMGILLSNFSKEAESGEAAANAIVFPIMFLSGTFWPKEILPDFLQTIARFMPLTYVNDGLRDAMVSFDFTQLTSNLMFAGALAVVFIVLGTLTMSWREE